MKTRDGSFWLLALGITVSATMIVHAPMLKGKVPFPADLVLNFPPFAKVRPPDPQPLHGNIGDLVMSFYPYRTLLGRAAREGTLPFWNPYMMSGAPFVASAQSAVFYPPNFLYYVLPVPLAWSIGFVLRRVLAMLFTILFARRIGCSPASAICAGLLFSFCGFMTGWQGQAMADTAIWLPLICYSVVRLRSDLTLRSVAITAFAFAMPVLAGHPETAAHLTLTGVALAAAVLPGAPRPFAFVKCFSVAGLLAIGFAGVQILPTLQWLQYIHHAFDAWPTLAPWTIIGLVSRDIIRPISSIGLRIPEEAAYLGMIGLVAAPVALRHSSRRLVAFWILWTALALSAVYGVGPGAWLAEHLPGIKSLKNMRMILIYSFGLSVLAGLGISWLENNAEHAPSAARIRAGMFALIGFSIGCMLLFVTRTFATEAIEYIRLPQFSFFLLATSVVIVAARLAGLNRRFFQVLIVSLTVFDVVTVSYAGTPHVKPKDVFPHIDLFDRLPVDPQNPSRIVGLGYGYGTNFEMPYGLSAVGGYEIGLERLKTFLADITRDEMDSVSLSTNGVLDASDRRIDMLNAKYVIVSEWDSRWLDFRKKPEHFRFMYTVDDTDVYENLHALPAALLVPASGAEVIRDEAAQLQRVKDPSFDPTRQVVLTEKPPEAGTREPMHSAVEWRIRRTNDFGLDVMTDQPSMLVISQNYYPGWRAYIDNQLVPITRANFVLPAVFVSPGRHHVRFVFVSIPIRLGFILSVSSAGVLVWMLLGFKKTQATSEQLESTLRKG